MPSSTTHEVHQFHLVAVVNRRRAQLRTPHDHAIVLDYDHARIQIKGTQEIQERRGRVELP
jgi:hypothetical protein